MQQLQRILLTMMILIAALHAREAAARPLTGEGAAPAGSQPPNKPLKVILDHDGGVDDLITLILLLSQPQKVQLLGVTILEADCIGEVAINSTLKILNLLKKPNVPVGLSTLKGEHAFPMQYRVEPLAVDLLPILNGPEVSLSQLKQQQLAKQPGQELLAQLLLKQAEPVTLVITAPLSNLAYVLKKYPAAAAKIKQAYWMGGALKTGGNTFTEQNSTGTSEWNVYWDAPAAGAVFDSQVPLTIVPLDATNKVPVTPDILLALGKQNKYIYSTLVGTMWAPVVQWIYSRPKDPYYMWDTVTAACLLQPSLCKIEKGLTVDVVLSGSASGTLRMQGGTTSLDSNAGAPVSKPKVLSAVLDVNTQEFNKFLLSAFKQ